LLAAVGNPDRRRSVFTVVGVGAVADVYFNGTDGGRHADAFAYVLLIGQTLPLAFRHRYPLGTMYTVCLSLGLYWVLDYPLGFDGAAVIAVYSGAAYGLGRRRTWRHLVIVVMTVEVLAWAPWSTIEQFRRRRRSNSGLRWPSPMNASESLAKCTMSPSTGGASFRCRGRHRVDRDW
jgi:hypothetical protein